MVFALANPDPEIDPMEAQQHAAVVATGRSDYPNQINNVLAFPGVFRGLLDAQATRPSPTRCWCAAADAIADVVDGRISSTPRSSCRACSTNGAWPSPAVAEAVAQGGRPPSGAK